MQYSGKYIRIGILDNDVLTMGALQQVLCRYLPKSKVIWKQTNGERAISLCADSATKPDALIVDASLDGMTGSEVCRRIRVQDAEIILIGITSFRLSRFHDSMIINGAQCLLPKDRPPIICEAITSLCECRIPDDDHFSAERAVEAQRRLEAEQEKNLVQVVTLSPREEEVMSWIDSGKTFSWIAKRLNTSDSTIKTYARRIYAKLGVRTKVEALILWHSRRSE